MATIWPYFRLNSHTRWTNTRLAYGGLKQHFSMCVVVIALCHNSIYFYMDSSVLPFFFFFFFSCTEIWGPPSVWLPHWMWHQHRWVSSCHGLWRWLCLYLFVVFFSDCQGAPRPWPGMHACNVPSCAPPVFGFVRLGRYPLNLWVKKQTNKQTK